MDKYPQTVAVILRGPNGIFISERLDTETLSGHHQVAGGRVDPGETFLQAAVRETQEETELDISPERFMEVWRGEVATSKEEAIFLVDLTAAEIPGNPEPDKCTPWVAFELEHAITGLNLVPSLPPVFRILPPRAH